MKFVARPPELREESRVKAYILRAAGKESFSVLRQRERRARAEEKFIRGLRSFDPGPEDEIDREERIALVRAYAAELPEQCARVFRLVFEDGLTHQQVADQLGISKRAVEKQMARARSILAEAIIGRWKERERESERERERERERTLQVEVAPDPDEP